MGQSAGPESDPRRTRGVACYDPAVHARRLWWFGLAAGLVAVGCGATQQGGVRIPEGGTPPRGAIAEVPPPPQPLAQAARDVAVGALCPNLSGGRPGVRLIAARKSLGWTEDPAELEELLRRQRIEGFTVLGPTGTKIGTFTAVGSDSEAQTPTAVGGYAGSAPCDGAPKGCGTLTDGCALAVALVARPGEGDAPKVRAGGACVDKGLVYVDLDGDGNTVAFPASAFVDESKAPAEEVIGTPAGAPCTPGFQGAEVADHMKDPKAFQGADIVAVADLDDDGRLELVVVLRYGDRRTWAIFGAGQSERQLLQLAEGAR